MQREEGLLSMNMKERRPRGRWHRPEQLVQPCAPRGFPTVTPPGPEGITKVAPPAVLNPAARLHACSERRPP